MNELSRDQLHSFINQDPFLHSLQQSSQNVGYQAGRKTFKLEKDDGPFPKDDSFDELNELTNF